MTNVPSFMKMPTGETVGKGRKRDLVVEVKGYHFPEGKDKPGVLEVEDLQSKRTLFVQISKYADQRFTSQALWEGNHIDKRMEENNPKGTIVVLEGLVDYGPDSGKDISKPLPINWIAGAPQNKDKIVQGVLTLRGNKERVFDVQVWDQQAIKVEDIEQLKDTFNQAVEYYQRNKAHHEETGEHLPRKSIPGVQFRAVLDGVVVEMSPPVQDHMLDQTAPDKRLPLSFEEIKMAAEYFKQHIAARYPNAVVEVTTFKSYPASQNLTHAETSPLATMALTKGKLAPDADYPAFGGATLATEGVLLLSPGKLNPKTGKRIGEENDWANNVFVSGKKFPVQEMILTTEGIKPVLSEALAVQYPRTTQEQALAEKAEAQQAQSASPQAEVSAPNEEESMDMDIHAALRVINEMSFEDTPSAPSSRGMSM